MPDFTVEVPLKLYTTTECHLCEEAETLLRAAQQLNSAVRWDRVDVADDEELFNRYGWLIPVVRHDSGAELRWPFDGALLAEFLAVNE
ncbi:MAG: glutaredoxin family protein [Pseudomonadota bacterium]